MGRWDDLGPEGQKEVAAAVESARKSGRVVWRRLSAAFGLPTETLRRRFDPGFAIMRAEAIRRRKAERGRQTGSIRVEAEPSYIKADAEARRALIPDDTRNLSARAFGDPLPGRSALDKRLNRERLISENDSAIGGDPIRGKEDGDDGRNGEIHTGDGED